MAAVMRGDLVFRPAAPEDAAFAADVMTAVRPASPVDPVVLRYWWTQPDESLEFARFVVLRGGGRIGFAMTEHARWGVQPERYEIYTATLQKRLPKFKVPLAPDDRDALLDLQAAFTRAYDLGNFTAQIDYKSPPPPDVPLSDASAAWLDLTLKTQKLR